MCPLKWNKFPWIILAFFALVMTSCMWISSEMYQYWGTPFFFFFRSNIFIVLFVFFVTNWLQTKELPKSSWSPTFASRQHWIHDEPYLSSSKTIEILWNISKNRCDYSFSLNLLRLHEPRMSILNLWLLGFCRSAGSSFELARSFACKEDSKIILISRRRGYFQRTSVFLVTVKSTRRSCWI